MKCELDNNRAKTEGDQKDFVCPPNSDIYTVVCAVKNNHPKKTEMGEMIGKRAPRINENGRRRERESFWVII
jgi:hypothetical protein